MVPSLYLCAADITATVAVAINMQKSVLRYCQPKRKPSMKPTPSFSTQYPTYSFKQNPTENRMCHDEIKMKNHLEHARTHSFSMFVCVFKLFTHRRLFPPPLSLRLLVCMGKLHMFNFKSNDLKATEQARKKIQRNKKEEDEERKHRKKVRKTYLLPGSCTHHLKIAAHST